MAKDVVVSKSSVAVRRPPVATLPFEVKTLLKDLGSSVRTARVRRELTQSDLALKCQITRKTLSAIETGVPGVALGSFLTVLWALGLLDSAKALVDPAADEHGLVLEAARRKKRVRPTNPIDNDF